MEGHRKFLEGGGVLKVKILESMYEAKLEFPRGGGCKTKSPPWGKYRYFLELHVSLSTFTINDVMRSVRIKKKGKERRSSKPEGLVTQNHLETTILFSNNTKME